MNIDSVLIFKIVLTHYIHAAQWVSFSFFPSLPPLPWCSCNPLKWSWVSRWKYIKLSDKKLINLLLYGDTNLILIRTLDYWIQELVYNRFRQTYCSTCLIYGCVYTHPFIIFLLQNMTKSFITLLSPLFIYYILYKFNMIYIW